MFTERLMNGDTLEQAVEHHYELCDYDFMQSLKVKADSPTDDEDPFDYNDLLNEITKTSAKKIGSAQDKLQQILQKGIYMYPSHHYCLYTYICTYIYITCIHLKTKMHSSLLLS